LPNPEASALTTSRSSANVKNNDGSDAL
jgi:hypothetical protein